MRRLFLSIITGFLLTVPCYGNINIERPTGDVLKMGLGARPLGMGGAFCAVSDDISCIYYNQAGLAGIKGREFISSGTRLWVEDIYRVFLGYGRRLEKGNAFGMSIVYLDYGKFDMRYAIEDKYKPTSIGQDITLVLSYSQAIGHLSIGANGKVIFSKLYNEVGKGFGGDVGILFTPTSFLSIGLNCQNIGSLKIRTSEDLPFNVKAGFAIRFHDKMIIAADVDRFKEDDIRYHGGLEFLISPSFAIRCGYSKNDATGLLPGASLGFGLFDKKGRLFNKQGEIIFDYALQSFGDLGLDHRVSIIFKF